jgi:hypothetical protein
MLLIEVIAPFIHSWILAMILFATPDRIVVIAFPINVIELMTTLDHPWNACTISCATATTRLMNHLRIKLTDLIPTLSPWSIARRIFPNNHTLSCHSLRCIHKASRIPPNASPISEKKKPTAFPISIKREKIASP